MCREQFLLPHRPFFFLGTSSLGIQNLCRGRQCRYNSNEVIGLNWLLILWIYTIHSCLHSVGDFVLELSPQPKLGVTQKSICIMSTQLPLSAKCKLSEEILDPFDKPSSHKTLLTNRSCVFIPEHWPLPALPGARAGWPACTSRVSRLPSGNTGTVLSFCLLEQGFLFIIPRPLELPGWPGTCFWFVFFLKSMLGIWAPS